MDYSHLKQLQDLVNYIELVTEKPLNDQQKEYIRGSLNLTYLDGYNKAYEVIVESGRE